MKIRPQFMALPAAERRAVSAWVSEVLVGAGFDPEQEDERRGVREFYTMARLEDGASPETATQRVLEYYAERRRRREQYAAEAPARAAARAAAEAERTAARAAERAARNAAIIAAAVHGTPVPAELRVGMRPPRCTLCRRPLTDPQSQALGLGPDCIENIRRECAGPGAA